MMNNTRSSKLAPKALTEMLASRDAMHRHEARRSLIVLGKPAVSVLSKALRTSTSNQLRLQAAKALGAIVDPRSIPMLVKALEDSESNVAWLAREALCPFKAEAWAPRLRELIATEVNVSSLRQGVHEVLVHQKRTGLNDAIANLLEAPQRTATPESTVLAVRQLLTRTEVTI